MDDIRASQVFNKVALLGLGLIGGSFAYALHQKYPDIKITAYDPAAGTTPEFIVHADNAADAIKGADLIVFSAPPGAFSALAKAIAPHIAEAAIVTDVGSVKLQAIHAIQPELPAYVYYIPGHPIAGKAENGLAAAEASLFAGKRVILAPLHGDGNYMQAVQRIKQLWQGLGAEIVIMSPDMHDLVYAYVSHLPQMVAFAMAPLLAGKMLNDEKYKRFVRLTGSDKKLWADIAVANAASLAHAIAAFNFNLQSLIESKGEQEVGDPVMFARVIGWCLHKTISALKVKDIEPVAYAGTGFKDMTACLPALGEEIIFGTECRQLEKRMNTIKHALHNREDLTGIFSNM